MLVHAGMIKFQKEASLKSWIKLTALAMILLPVNCDNEEEEIDRSDKVLKPSVSLFEGSRS